MLKNFFKAFSKGGDANRYSLLKLFYAPCGVDRRGRLCLGMGFASILVGLRHVYGKGEALGGELGLVGGESGIVEVMDGDLVDL